MTNHERVRELFLKARSLDTDEIERLLQPETPEIREELASLLVRDA